MTTAADIVRQIETDDIRYVDFRFTDTLGKWHHITQHRRTINEDYLVDGVMFDGSSIAGWKAINESDMLLIPDLDTAVLDPFAEEKTLIITCDVYEPGTGQSYARDPRSTAKKAEAYLRSTNIADTIYIGPEAEFFIFDDVKVQVSPYHSSFELNGADLPTASAKDFPGGNLGHRPLAKSGYFPVAPIDSATNLRGRMLSTMEKMGVQVEKHHHEVGPSQHELGFEYATMLKAADALQIYKYCIHNVAAEAGKSVTFMPKPVMGDNGSGLHIHQSLWKNGKPLFAGSGYADLSDAALYYIGGVIKHAKALNAFTNPLTNSYKRLVPGYEAPVLLAYSSRNRSASCRIPYVANPKAKRVEVRFPDPGANPYFACAALLMAGIDGIQNKIHPGDPMDKNLYDLPPDEQSNIERVSLSLADALRALEKDHAFLLKGDVFTKDLIDSYIEMKWEEVYAVQNYPHPLEYQMYYSV